ncbi:hypothetical protein CCH79_00015079 [Gambusia affinis]|uniref:Uncharacterized protein n=1 Tax=Gambusia affinis TaxID=33528 RepID=A0A315WAQ2_GAMAF|nr:hypothetical protein CCH79_00015079 [Gambusia affinis]
MAHTAASEYECKDFFSLKPQTEEERGHISATRHQRIASEGVSSSGEEQEAANGKAWKRLNRLICRAGSVVGVSLESVESVVEQRTLSELSLVLENTSHPLCTVFSNQRSSFSDSPAKVFPLELLELLLREQRLSLLGLFHRVNEDLDSCEQKADTRSSLRCFYLYTYCRVQPSAEVRLHT